ncbi:phospholipase A2 inhibitor gamma subunit B-like [Grus japonensis]|uniref:Phospholipase A2 inhibitor gamma subunit B-like n=1 Tax=Grus japonensis TaxID=30415 RepID=A0ABC9XZS0_GRUJA
MLMAAMDCVLCSLCVKKHGLWVRGTGDGNPFVHQVLPAIQHLPAWPYHHELREVPPENNVPNGYQCPACYTVDSFQCGGEIVNCTGSETQCVDLAGLMNSGGLSLKAAMKGCTTISECNLVGDGKNNLGMMDIKLRQFQCRPASVLARVTSGFSPPDTFFLPVLSGFILEKEKIAGLGPSDQMWASAMGNKDDDPDHPEGDSHTVQDSPEQEKEKDRWGIRNYWAL